MVRLVRILRKLRAYLIERGVVFRFDTRVDGFLTRGGADRDVIRGVKLGCGGEIVSDRWVKLEVELCGGHQYWTIGL